MYLQSEVTSCADMYTFYTNNLLTPSVMHWHTYNRLFSNLLWENNCKKVMEHFDCITDLTSLYATWCVLLGSVLLFNILFQFVRSPHCFLLAAYVSHCLSVCL